MCIYGMGWCPDRLRIGHRRTVAAGRDAIRRSAPPLIVDERHMRCPRCRAVHDILRYVPMGIVEEFRTEANPIYKCPSCRWIFSPALTPNEMRALINELSERERE